MRLRGAVQATALIAATIWATPLSAATDEPTLSINAFEHEPIYLSYFEDSNDILFLDPVSNTVFRSENAGVSWKPVDGVKRGEAYGLVMHRYDRVRAYILTKGIQHYRTGDRGKTWEMFLTDARINDVFSSSSVMQFHASDPDRIIFNGLDCDKQFDIFCELSLMYTTDGFATAAKPLRNGASGCWWAKSSSLFTTGDDKLDQNRILCLVPSPYSNSLNDDRLVISDDFFQRKEAKGAMQEFEPQLDTDKVVKGVVSVAAVKKYLLAATASANTDEMELFVTDDTYKWHRAIFPTTHRITQGAYTVLESTNYSIQIDVMNTRPSNPMGVMFTSNSNGTYFTENIQHTNRNDKGYVDFEKISGIQGIFLVNKVMNWDQVEKDQNAQKKKVTEITFDDGRTFEDVKAGGKRIHLHSVTELQNVGRVFSSPAPGIVMGNGNTGEYLGGYAESDLYVSDDAGKTWTKARDGPHKYEFGDQGSILVAVRDSTKHDVDEISYSLNHGRDWKQVKLPLVDGAKIKPIILTTTQDSTSLKFILTSQTASGSKRYQVFALDFAGLHEATCTSNDMEVWHARVDDNKKPTCLMGHKQSYQRRKKDAKCFLNKEFRETIVETEDCQCTAQDYECDYNFVQAGEERIECRPATKKALKVPEGACRGDRPDEKFKGPSGWRKIPGNTCIAGRDAVQDGEKEWKCSDAEGPPTSGTTPATDELKIKKSDVFPGRQMEKHYLERGATSSSDDETIIMRPVDGAKAGGIWITHDHGKTWSQPDSLKDRDIGQIIPHSHFKDMVFFVEASGEVIYTVDRGRHFNMFKAPIKPDGEEMALQFHPNHKDWLLWHGRKCGLGDTTCFSEVLHSSDRGDDWKTLARYAKNCHFTGSSEYRLPERKIDQVVCLEKESENNDDKTPWQVVTYEDYPSKPEPEAVVKKARDYAIMAEFMVAATADDDGLKALVSVDGHTFAEAQFPDNHALPNHSEAYTVLESSSHAVFMFVKAPSDGGHLRGHIVKSNSNGTSYVLSVANVNCNTDFYVDFEKMKGLEGVALVNTVTNPDVQSETKQLRTQITHNDGAQWAYLPPPTQDLEGRAYCRSAKGDDKCALHLHGYTERTDHRKTYSSAGAVGLMFGWGNVGPALGPAAEADTFMTRDAGISWRQVAKGRYMWSMADHGAVIVLVQTVTETRARTNELLYSVDGGVSFKPHTFHDTKVEVLDVTTLRLGGSRNFLLWVRSSDGLFTLNLDFSAFFEGLCNLDRDYDVWSPKHPLQETNCLFGHVSQYLRKKEKRKCYNDFHLPTLYGEQNCSCTRQDYECAYNFELDNNGQCHLVPGHKPLTAEEWCARNPDAIEYYEASSYRRIPLTTCVGGREFDKASAPQPCPGHERDFERAHRGLSALGLLLAITLPIAFAAAAGWWMWRNWSGKFGQIRLGEQAPSPFSLDSDQPWVRYPVMAVSAMVAFAASLPLVASALWRSTERWRDGWSRPSGGSWSRLNGNGSAAGGPPRSFTTRDSFSRGRGEYEGDDDEGELLGEDSDEEV